MHRVIQMTQVHVHVIAEASLLHLEAVSLHLLGWLVVLVIGVAKDTSILPSLATWLVTTMMLLLQYVKALKI